MEEWEILISREKGTLYLKRYARARRAIQINPKDQLKRVLFCLGLSLIVLFLVWIFKDYTKNEDELNIITTPATTTNTTVAKNTTVDVKSDNKTAPSETSQTQTETQTNKTASDITSKVNTSANVNTSTNNTRENGTTTLSDTTKISKGKLIITQEESVTESITSVTEGATSTTKNTTTSTNTTSITSAKTNKYFPTEQELMMMCTVVCSETGYCDTKVQRAVAHTIVNRVYSDDFPNNVYQVVTQRNQYSCISRYFNSNMRKGCEIGSENWNRSMQVCIDVWDEYDFTNGAVAYYNPYMKGYNAWFEQFTLVYEDEYGRFFRV